MINKIPQSILVFKAEQIGIAKNFLIDRIDEAEYIKEIESSMEVLRQKLYLYKRDVFCIYCDSSKIICKCVKH